MLYLVNRHTGASVEWNPVFGTQNFPPKSFFETGSFARKGHVIELVSVTPEEHEYFGVKYRMDRFEVLLRGQLDAFGVKMLED